MTAVLDSRAATIAEPRARARILEIDVVTGSDPIRLARTISAMINNTRVALYEVDVDDQPAYPVPAMVVTRRGRCVLRMRLRDQGDSLDQLLVEEILQIVSGACRVVEIRRSR